MITLRQAELGVDLFTGLVVASVAVALAGLTWHVIAPATESAAPVALARRSVAAMVDVTPALKAAPFGIAAAAASEDPSSDQPLRLHGIVFANPATASSALIGSGDGDPRAYRAGETLPSGAVLRAIALDHVTLDVSGSAETLGFPRPQASGSDDRSSSDDGGDGGGGVDAIRALIPASAGGGAADKTDVATVAKTRDRIDDSPRSFLDSLGATAAAGGYRIGASPSADLRTAGLMPGDVIERVDGVAVGDPAKDRALFDQAVAAGSARVTVRRDGRSYTFSFPIR